MIGLVSGGGHIGKPAYVDSWLCLTQIQSEEELQAKGNHPTSKIHFASFLPELQRRSLKILWLSGQPSPSRKDSTRTKPPQQKILIEQGKRVYLT